MTYFPHEDFPHPAANSQVIELAKLVKTIHLNPPEIQLSRSEIMERSRESDQLLAKIENQSNLKKLATFMKESREISQSFNRKTPCHNDLWAPNIMVQGQEIRITDFEDFALCDALFELAYTSFLNRFTDEQDELFLKAYFGEKIYPSVYPDFLQRKFVTAMQVVIAKHLIEIEAENNKLPVLEGSVKRWSEVTFAGADDQETLIAILVSAFHEAESIREMIAEYHSPSAPRAKP